MGSTVDKKEPRNIKVTDLVPQDGRDYVHLLPSGILVPPRAVAARRQPDKKIDAEKPNGK